MTPEAKAELRLRVQSKKASLMEALTNTVVGLCISFVLNLMLYRVYGVQVATSTAISIVMWMTLASVVRGYVLRRLWNSEWWKRWRKQTVVTQTSLRGVVRLGTELSRLTPEQAAQVNQRLLSYLDKEIERVLYGHKH